MNDLIIDIKKAVGIKGGGIYIDQAIEAYVSDLLPSEYLEFFIALNGGDFSFKSGLDRVAMVSEVFRERKHALLMKNVPSKAQDLANRLYDLKMKAQDNYGYVVFKGCMVDGKDYFSDMELVVIENLGGRELLRVVDTQEMGVTVARIKAEMEKVNSERAKKLSLTSKTNKLEISR